MDCTWLEELSIQTSYCLAMLRTCSWTLHLRCSFFLRNRLRNHNESFFWTTHLISPTEKSLFIPPHLLEAQYSEAFKELGLSIELFLNLSKVTFYYIWCQRSWKPFFSSLPQSDFGCFADASVMEILPKERCFYFYYNN